LIYLANEVAQQSRVRRKDDFPRAFSGVIAEAMEIAYRGTTQAIQTKIRRVLDVWRTRNVFEPSVLGDIDQRFEGIIRTRQELTTAIDKTKGKGGIIRPVKSSAGPAIPPELVSPWLTKLTNLEQLNIPP